MDNFLPEIDKLKEIREFRRKNITSYPTVTVLLATQRPNDLMKILPQINSQTLMEFSLSIGMHGFELTEEHQKLITALNARGIQTTITTFDSNKTLGIILTSLSENCSSQYLAKMDDDDIYGPNHLQDLLDAANDKSADLVGRAMNYIYLEAIDITVRRFANTGVSEVELWSPWVCGGTILVKRELAQKVGYFGEGKSGVDNYLLTGVLAAGGKIFRTFGAGYIYRRSVVGHTYNTNYAKYLIYCTDKKIGLWSDKEFGTDE